VVTEDGRKIFTDKHMDAGSEILITWDRLITGDRYKYPLGYTYDWFIAEITYPDTHADNETQGQNVDNPPEVV